MSLPDALTHQDKLLTVNTTAQPYRSGLLHPGIQAVPLFLEPYNGTWVFPVKFAPDATLPLHFHAGCAQLYDRGGFWHYTEYPERKQTSGCYLFEQGGSLDQFNTPAEDTDVFMVVMGANVNFLDNSEFVSASN